MKSLIIVFLSIFLTISYTQSQSLTSARSNTYKNIVTKHGLPRVIINNNVFYTTSGIIKKKEVIEFSINMDTIIETRYKDGVNDAQLMFVFNSNKQLIYRSFKDKVPLFGWQSRQSSYSYDENGLSEIRTTNSNKQLKSLAIVKCDTMGNPISFKLYDPEMNLIGYETGEYFYDENKWYYRVFNQLGELSSEEKLNIESIRSEDSKYNERGDCIFYPRNWSDSDKTYYQVEYKYDEYGNWVEQRIYKGNKIGNDFMGKSLERKFKRKIKYKN